MIDNSDLRPTFIIAGTMRSGTSSLNAYLREHPEIAVSKPKEVHFFDRNYEKGSDWYRKHFEPTERLAVGEATPDYLYDRLAPSRIAKDLPQVRIIVMIREPASRAYSHYWHNRSRGIEPLSFDEAIGSENERIARSPQDRMRYSYVDRGRYAAQLRRLAEYIPGDRILVKTFDELQADPLNLYFETCRFLGIDDNFVPSNLGSKVNAHVEFRSPRLRSLTKKWPKKLRNAIAKLNRASAGPYPQMTSTSQAFIESELSEDLSLLSLMVDDRVFWIPRVGD
jgi:hypothetical protein